MKHTYIFFFLLLIASNCFSQWNKDSLVRNPVCVEPNSQYYARSCTDGAGGAIFTWVDERNITSPSIYAQKINVKGKTAWATNGIPIYVSGISSSGAVNSTIVADGSGGAILVMEISVLGGANQLWAQHINSAGALLWGNGVQITDAPDSRLRWVEDPQQYGISADGSGGAFVTWQAYQMPYFNYAQHINANGSLAWGITGVPLPQVNGNNGYRTVIVSTGNGTAVAGFTNYNGSLYYLQRIAADGSYLWGSNGVQISGIYSNQSDAFNIIYDPVNAFVFTAFESNTSSSATDLNVQKLDLNGNLLWAAGGVNITNLSSGDVQQPDLLPDGKGGLFTASLVNGSANVQHTNKKGIILWGASGIYVDNIHIQNNPVIVSDGGAGFIVTYNTTRSFSSGSYPIYSQHYTAAGAASWQSGGVAVMANYTNIDHEVPYTIASTKGFAITCWQDSRNSSTTSYDIYAARYGGVTGMSLTAPQEESIIATKSIQDNIPSINTYPNPASSDVAVSFILDDNVADASLTIYDATGRKVKYLLWGNLQAGKQLFHINTQDLSNGVYNVVMLYSKGKQEGKIVISK